MLPPPGDQTQTPSPTPPPFVEFTIEHSIVTENSPSERDLKGNMQLTVKQGDAKNIELIEVITDPDTGAKREQKVSLPYTTNVVEKGHSGCGLHTWHTGSLSFKARAINFGGVALTAKVNPVKGASRDTVDIVLSPMQVNCPELYMFSRHSGDKVDLCKISGIACEWKLKDSNPVIGTFDHPTDLSCSFTATAPGKNTIQLLVGGTVAWEKSTEILDLKARATWGANPVDMAHMDGTMAPIAGVTFHHSSNTNDGVAEIQRIQTEHQARFPYWTHKNFGDIGYHFVMTKDGTIYVGRELEAAPGSPGGPYTLGAHVLKKNTPSGVGMCMLGNYDREVFSAAHQKDLEKALAAICRRYKLTANQVSYHTARASVAPIEETTNCPAANVISKAKEINDHVRQNLE